jgi:copper(I)-binding protein
MHSRLFPDRWSTPIISAAMNRFQLKSTLLQSVFLAGFALSMSPTIEAQSAIEFDNIWIAEAPPGSQVMAAYMDIKNTGNEVLRVKPLQSNDFKKIEFHRTFYEDGMARMQHLPELAIPAHSTLSLEPGSYHMMLFNPERKLKAGDQSTLIFKLEGQLEDQQKSSNQIEVTAHVKKQAFGQADKHSDHSHH